jgi:hypothetical protein
MSKDDSSRQMINVANLQAAEQLPTQQSVAQYQSGTQLNVPEMQSPVQAQIADRLPREHPSDDRSDWERPADRSASTDPRWRMEGGLPERATVCLAWSKGCMIGCMTTNRQCEAGKFPWPDMSKWRVVARGGLPEQRSAPNNTPVSKGLDVLSCPVAAWPSTTIGLRSDTCASGAAGVAGTITPPPPLPAALRGLTSDECRRIGDTLVELGEWLRRRA